MSKEGVMTSRDLSRVGGTTGAARVQQDREAEKVKTLKEQIAFKELEAEKEDERKRIKLAKMIAEEMAKKKPTKKAKAKNVKN